MNPIRFTLRLLITVLATLVSSAGSSPVYCQLAPAKEPARDRGVTVGKPMLKTLRRVIEQRATVDPYEETPLVARVEGYVEKVQADIGTRVKAGDLLAVLSVPELIEDLPKRQALIALANAEVVQTVAAREIAQATLATSRAQVRESQASLARAEAHYARLKLELTRIEKLVAERAIDRQTRDETFKQFKAAEENRQEAEAKVKSSEAMALEIEAKARRANADIEAAKARVGVAKAEEGRVRVMAEYRDIKAPFDGIVTRRNIHRGQLLQPNSNNAAFVVSRTDLLRIHAEIPESEAIYINDGLSVRMEVPTMKNQIFTAKVSRTSGAVDLKTRTLRAEIDFPNPDGKLRPGVSATLIFVIELPNCRTIPSQAIFMHAGQPCCWRVVAGKAVRTPLKLGVRDGQVVEVLKMQTHGAGNPVELAVWASMTGDEEIILTNLTTVVEGKAVQIQRE